MSKCCVSDDSRNPLASDVEREIVAKSKTDFTVRLACLLEIL